LISGFLPQGGYKRGECSAVGGMAGQDFLGGGARGGFPLGEKWNSQGHGRNSVTEAWGVVDIVTGKERGIVFTGKRGRCSDNGAEKNRVGREAVQVAVVKGDIYFGIEGSLLSLN